MKKYSAIVFSLTAIILSACGTARESNSETASRGVRCMYVSWKQGGGQYARVTGWENSARFSAAKRNCAAWKAKASGRTCAIGVANMLPNDHACK